ncbi:MAG: hypothetical protein E7373_02845 [Clostridiales bacterium]|nr:hypothetical protein [Clostridiales bacterium]
MSNTIEKKKVNLFTKIAVIFLAVILFFCLIFGCAVGYFRLTVAHYYQASEKAFVIPGLDDGHVPQGLDFDKENELFIFSGYMADHTASPVYVTNKEGTLLKKVTLYNLDGSDYTGHGGGIAVNGDYMYLAGGESNCVFVYSYLELLSAKDGDKLSCLGSISTQKSETDYISNAFVTIYDGKLITGEFYREESYPTLDSHKITTKAGDYNQAIAVEFLLDETAPFGINPTPVKAYSMPDQVQGLNFNNGKVYLSTSWGLSFSHILEYDLNKLSLEDEIEVLGTTLPLYAMDSASLLNDFKIPPMSEEVVFIQGKLFTSCESASSKYIFGKFTGGKWFYATDLEKFNV